MCLVTVTGRKVAANDIPVKKLFDRESYLQGEYVSPYYMYQYPDKGLQPKVKMAVVRKTITVAYESGGITFFDDYDTDYYKKNHAGETVNVISKGYHSASTERATPYHNLLDYCMTMVDCYIPKGAEYYEDATGLFVSDTIFIGTLE